MTAKELREKFQDYFVSKDHKIIDSASLLPDNDPTVLFTTAGMHPLVPYLMGETHPEGKRLVNVQKCLRTGDIDEVGDKTHHTFFEMLGNWSLGDYFKKEAINYAWEFVTKELKLDKDKLAISIFGGNDDVKEYDKESEDYWLALGIEPNKISKVSDNWWGPAGESGPCGPDTEIFYWTSTEPVPDKFDEDDDRWVEIWNNVLMEYTKTAQGKYEPLKQKNIDTGMGLERTLAVLNNTDDNYQTELFIPIIKKIEKLSGKKYTDDKKSFRIIADHIRSAVFVLGDGKGVCPSNTGQGYVLRRLIRRAVVLGHRMDIHDFMPTLAKVVIDNYQGAYQELKTKQDFILQELEKEEANFELTLTKGLKEFEKIGDKITPLTAFELSATFGFPIEMTIELAKERYNKILPIEKIKEASLKHQELSRTASAGMFKGGLADDSEQSKKYHTANHLLLQALRDILGKHVEQRGSNINTERLRFDFVHDAKMTPEQIKEVEDIVNQKIKAALDVSCKEMSVDEAKQGGAIGVFDQKYGAKVKVYSMGDYSKEICGGPHVKNTSELGTFSIAKESSSSAGIRRIKAILK